MSLIVTLAYHAATIFLMWGGGLMIYACFSINMSRYIKGASGERRVRKYLKRCMFDSLNDLYIPFETAKGEKSCVQIDHVIRTEFGIMVLETKNWTGKIFGRAADKKWTRDTGTIRYKIENPLVQNDHQQRRLIDYTELSGDFSDAVGSVVIFTGKAELSPILRDNIRLVTSPRELRDAIGCYNPPFFNPASVDFAWEKLSMLAERHKELKKLHRSRRRLYLKQDDFVASIGGWLCLVLGVPLSLYGFYLNCFPKFGG